MTWYEQAVEKLDKEYKNGKYDRYANAMKSAVRDALKDFCRQDEEFAQAVVQGGTFEDCMKSVAKGVSSSISDLDAYRRAVSFYFDGAKVEFQMKITLTPAAVETHSTAEHGILLNFEDFI